MAFVDIDQGEEVALATETGDDGALVDITACLTDDTSATSCVEVKAGQGLRIEVFLDPATLDPAGTHTLRLGINQAMTTGTLRIAPYSDVDSIDDTNGITTAAILGAGDVDTVLDAAFIADLADLGGGRFAIRVFENGSLAKIKVGEADVEFEQILYTVAGVTRDRKTDPLGSVEYQIYRRMSITPEVLALVASGVSNASTGAHSDDIPRASYRIVTIKDVEPQVMDIGPPLIVFNGETDDVLTLGMGHGLANDDEIQVYQAGSPALPVGLSVDQIYFVISQSGNTISLSLTQGGGAVDLTVAGEGILVGKPLRSAA
jgi:hypothetical protein